ncbi:uncharacterized protein [Venturia canescens]|uniref:uncharacterized protein n=1 Tax=Venturia canescens TaxID=32260 RepID=UPI001C9BF27E|nr:uncharacterized protein LOC122405961 [Venturia canescens]
MSGFGSFWPAAIVIFLLRSNFGVCGNLRQDPKDPWRGLSMTCNGDDPKNTSISCHGMRIVKRVIQQLLDSATTNVEITSGVSLVNSEDGGAAVRRARNLKGFGKMGPILGLLEGKELRVKLPSLMPANLESAIKDSLPTGRGSGGGGFGGGKKGDNGLLIMAVMMGKMMAAIGFGSLGMLAMKALMVSSLALMLSLIVAAKKFASSQDSGGGHHVVYAQESGHHHSKRSVDFDDPEFSPYSGYASLYGISRFS